MCIPTHWNATLIASVLCHQEESTFCPFLCYLCFITFMRKKWNLLWVQTLSFCSLLLYPMILCPPGREAELWSTTTPCGSCFDWAINKPFYGGLEPQQGIDKFVASSSSVPWTAVLSHKSVHTISFTCWHPTIVKGVCLSLLKLSRTHFKVNSSVLLPSECPGFGCPT